MTTMSRAARMEQNLKKKRCPRCREPRLIQKQPKVYNEVRCMNCGAVGRVRENISHD